MPVRSAGILLYSRPSGRIEVLLAHPGGPYWAKKDLGAWSIPKGELAPGEEPEAAARREFLEELGSEVTAALVPLGDARQASGKRVLAFAAEGAFDCASVESELFEIEWPPRSGRRRSFPEVDRAEWFPLDVAREKIVAGQRVFLERLEAMLARGSA